MSETDILLDVKNLQTFFKGTAGSIRAVDGVSLSIRRGETIALVGESGCGKSVLALSLARLVSAPGYHPSGEILFRGSDVLKMDERRLTHLRGADISYIFQEPSTSLNPVFKVGYQIAEAVKLHASRLPDSTQNTVERVVSLMNLVGLPEPHRRMNAYPHEMSGGMQQRVMIAMALACSPSLLVADEPTTALDVTIQAQILELLRDLQNKLNMAILLITHNLGLVADMAHAVHVMYAGRIVETGLTKSLLTRPGHPYTRGLLDAVPRLQSTSALKGIKGSVPHPAHLPPGCKFAPRCPFAQAVCSVDEPSLAETHTPYHFVRCHFPLNTVTKGPQSD